MGLKTIRRFPWSIPGKTQGSYKTGPSPIGERHFQQGELRENSIG